jgi:hypothetical protein
MRTTLTLEPDAFEAAKAKAAHERLTLGKAVSELILQAIRQAQPEVEAAAVFRSPGGLRAGPLASVLQRCFRSSPIDHP